jgi:hypothetical protein
MNGGSLSEPSALVHNKMDTLPSVSGLLPKTAGCDKDLFERTRMYGPVSLQLYIY